MFANFGESTEDMENGIYKVKYTVNAVERLDKVWNSVHLFTNPAAVQSLSKSERCPDFAHLEIWFCFIFATGQRLDKVWICVHVHKNPAGV